MRIESVTSIQCSPAEVFAYLIEPGKLMQWQSGLVGFRKLTQGEIGTGTTFKNVLSEIVGQKITFLGKVIAYTPNTYLKIEGQAPQIHLTIEYRITEQPPGIQVEQIGVFDSHGLFYRTISTFLHGFLQKRQVMIYSV